MLLSEALPSFSKELLALLQKAAEPELAEQVSIVEIVERCSCSDDFCSSFYTATKPHGPYGHGHRNVVLEPERGAIILDVVQQKMMFVEVLDRDDVRTELSIVLP